ncbi:hypothetical protein [Thermovibrio sp.]
MRKLLGIGSSLLILLGGCGGAGSGGGDLTSTTLANKIEQDLICCMSWDDTKNACTERATPTTKTEEITLKQADIEQEFTEESDLLFEGCDVRIVPNPNLPPEAKDPATLSKMEEYIYCTGTDIPQKGSGLIKVTYSQGLLNEIIRPLWNNLGKTLAYTIEVTAKYKKSDRVYKKVIKIPIDFDDFVYAEHDMCQ